MKPTSHLPESGALSSSRPVPEAASSPEGDILFVSHEFAPVVPGGIGVLLREVISRLSESSLRPRLLLDAPPRVVRRLRAHAARDLPGVPIHGVAELVGEGLPLHAFPCEAYYRSHLIWRAVEALCAQHPIAAVEFSDYLGAGFVTLKARRLGLCGEDLSRARVAVRIHGTAELAAKADGAFCFAPAQLQTFAMERYCLLHADALLSPSAGVVSWYRENIELAPAERVIQATPPSRCPGPANAHRAPCAEGPLRILFLGKLQPLKGVCELLGAYAAAAARLGAGALELHLVGSDTPTGPGGTSCRAWVEAAIPRSIAPAVHFHGQLSPESIRHLALRSHLAIFPSRMETFCLAAHELHWLGIPLLLSDIPAFRDHFEEGVDALFFDGSQTGLERQLQAIVADPGLLAGLEWTGDTRPPAVASSYRQILEMEPRSMPPPARTTGPLVSVVIPYYEMQDYVGATIESVDASLYRSWEVILVDDGSPSEAARRCFDRIEAERAEDERFRFIRKPNGGLSSARNAGIAAARGAFVLPLDADDCVHPRYLVLAVRALEAHPDLGFVSCIAARFRDGRLRRATTEWIVPGDPDPARLLFENCAGTASCLFRRSLFDKIRYDESLEAYEDWDLQLGLALAGIRGEVLPEVLLYYRERHDGLALTRGHPQHEQLLGRILDKHYESLPQEVRDGFKIHIQVSSALRGFGPSGARPLAGWRARALAGLRAFYLQRFKALGVRVLSERHRHQLAGWVRRALAPRA